MINAIIVLIILAGIAWLGLWVVCLALEYFK